MQSDNTHAIEIGCMGADASHIIQVVLVIGTTAVSPREVYVLDMGRVFAHGTSLWIWMCLSMVVWLCVCTLLTRDTVFLATRALFSPRDWLSFMNFGRND